MLNQDIRDYARRKGVYLYQVAASLQRSEATMTRLLRRELSEVEKQRVFRAINDAAAERGVGQP